MTVENVGGLNDFEQGLRVVHIKTADIIIGALRVSWAGDPHVILVRLAHQIGVNGMSTYF